MNSMTADNIIHELQMVQPELIADPTSVAYIQFILTPYAEAIEQASDIEILINWIESAYPGDLSKHGHSEAIKAYQNTEGDEITRMAAARFNAINYLIDEILELGGYVTKDTRDERILPWDIKRAMGNDEELKIMIADPDSKTLPIFVTIGAQNFEHLLSSELVAGIQDYYRLRGDNISMSMFGVMLSTDYLASEYGRFYEENNDTTYSVMIAGITRKFNTPDYITGAKTAAQWRNEDIHQYVTDLTMTNENGESVQLQF